MGTNPIIHVLADSLVIARRNIIRIKRVPDVLAFVLIQPLMFVVLFAYVFGGAIDIPGGNYREFLVAGIFAQTVVFGATFTGAGLAEAAQMDDPVARDDGQGGKHRRAGSGHGQELTGRVGDRSRPGGRSREGWVARAGRRRGTGTRRWGRRCY
jgi:hypothetical protein